MWILVISLSKKPADLDLHCFHKSVVNLEKKIVESELNWLNMVYNYSIEELSLRR